MIQQFGRVPRGEIPVARAGVAAVGRSLNPSASVTYWDGLQDRERSQGQRPRFYLDSLDNRRCCESERGMRREELVSTAARGNPCWTS